MVVLLLGQRWILAQRISSDSAMAIAIGANALWHGSTLALADGAADGTASVAMLAFFVFLVCAQAYQMRVTWNAPMYFAAPVTLASPSLRRTLLPTARPIAKL